MLASLTGARQWRLNIYVTDLQVQKSLDVYETTSLGEIMLDLVEKLDITTDWSDHGIWWPDRNKWLLKPRMTVLACGIQSETTLHFTPMHKTLRLQMPDLQHIDMRVNFAVPVFSAVKEIAADLGVRHPEEMSLTKPMESLMKGKERKALKPSKPGSKKSNKSNSSDDLSQGSLENGRGGRQGLSPPSPCTPRSNKSSDFLYTGTDPLNPYATALSPMLITSPAVGTNEAMHLLNRGKTLIERSVFNAGWLDSSVSFMEQGIMEFESLLLKFKYFNFFDLNPKIDDPRINQIYEQAKWQILSEEVECTEEEAITFGALHFQVKISSHTPQNPKDEETDDIDSALNDLQMSLEGTTANAPKVQQVTPVLTKIPEMADKLSLVKTKKLGLKSVKPYWFKFKDTHISYYKSEESSTGPPLQKFNLKGCEVIPEVNVSKDKYHIKLRIPGPDVYEIELACESDAQYSKWLAACRLAAKGKTMADTSFDAEKSSVKTFLNMQKDGGGGGEDIIVGDFGHIQAEDFVPPRLLAKYKKQQIAARVLEAHSQYTKLTPIEAKMNFIRQWQALPEFGITTFNVRFKGKKAAKKPEILGISFNRLVRMDAGTRDITHEWRYSDMRSWNVNWETREMIVQCEDETVIFSCNDCDVKLVHEFIGGYIFLTLRKDVNSPPDDETFMKLTGGWV